MSKAFSVSLLAETTTDRQVMVTGRRIPTNYVIPGRYNPILNNPAVPWGGQSATTYQMFSRYCSLISSAGTFKNFRQTVDASPSTYNGIPGDNSHYLMFEFQAWNHNTSGGATSLDFNIAGDSASGDSGVKTKAVTAGQLPCFFVNCNDGTLLNFSYAGDHTVDFIPTEAGGRIYDCVLNIDSGSSRYCSGVGTSINGDSSSDEQYTVIPTSGTIKNLYVDFLDTSPGAGKYCTVTVRKNSVDTSLALTINNTTQVGNNTSDSFTVSSGDLISIKGVTDSSNLSSSAKGPKIGWTFVADNPLETPIMLSNWGNAADYTSVFHPASGSVNTPAWNYLAASDAEARQPCYDCTIKKMVIRLDAAPATNNIRTFTVYKNGVATNLSAALTAGETTKIVTGSVVCGTSYFDRISIKEVLSNTVAEIICGTVGVVTGRISNIDHLEGQTVAIIADGEILSQQIVSGGSITLPASYSQVHVGLPYISDLETLNVEIPTKQGTVQARRVKIGNVTFRLVDSRGGWVGGDDNTLYEAFPNAIETKQGDIDDLYTGDIRVPLGDSYKGGGRLFFRQYDPLPVTIGAVVPEISVGGP